MPQTRFWIWVVLTLFIGIIITALREKQSPNQFEQSENTEHK